MLVYVEFAESYRNDKQNEIQGAYFGNQSFSLFTSCCYFQDATSEIRNKSVVVVTENSDHNIITSMSFLKKVIDIVEAEYGKSFTSVALWSDGMGAHFRSRFIFPLLAGTMFLNKSLYWFYNDRHHGKVPMDDVGGTIKNVIFRKVKSAEIVVHTPKEFFDAAMKFVPSIFTMYLPRSDKIVEPESIHQAPSIPKTLSISKFVRQINDRGDCSKEFFKTGVDQEAFHTQWYKLVMLFVVTRSPIKAIAKVERAGNGVQKTGVNGYNVPFVNNGFTKHVFYVSDGNNVFFISLI